MEKQNHLSDNLKAYQHARGQSLAEFSTELGIAKSTVQSVMSDGNTTLDTLIRMACAMHVSLDELVFGNKQLYEVRFFLDQLGWFSELPEEKQKKVLFYLVEMLKLLEHDE